MGAGNGANVARVLRFAIQFGFLKAFDDEGPFIGVNVGGPGVFDALAWFVLVGGHFLEGPRLQVSREEGVEFTQINEVGFVRAGAGIVRDAVANSP